MKRIVFVSTIMAILVASLSAFSAFAAPSAISKDWGQQFDALQADKNFYDHFVANHKNFVHPSDPIKIKVYLAEYAADLAKAEAIVGNRANESVNNAKGMTNAQVNHQDQTHQSAVANLAALLHDMRSLQAHLVQIG